MEEYFVGYKDECLTATGKRSGNTSIVLLRLEEIQSFLEKIKNIALSC